MTTETDSLQLSMLQTVTESISSSHLLMLLLLLLLLMLRFQHCSSVDNYCELVLIMRRQIRPGLAWRHGVDAWPGLAGRHGVALARHLL